MHTRATRPRIAAIQATRLLGSALAGGLLLATPLTSAWAQTSTANATPASSGSSGSATGGSTPAADLRTDDPDDWKGGCSGTWSIDAAAEPDYYEQAQDAIALISAHTGISFHQVPHGQGQGGNTRADLRIVETPGLTQNYGAWGRAHLGQGLAEIDTPNAVRAWAIAPDGAGQSGSPSALDRLAQRNVIAHEILHLLGSPHTQDTDSIMNPAGNYNTQPGAFELGQMAHLAGINGCTPWDAPPSAIAQAGQEEQEQQAAQVRQCQTAGGLYNPYDRRCIPAADIRGKIPNRKPLGHKATVANIMECSLHRGAYDTESQECRRDGKLVGLHPPTGRTPASRGRQAN